MMCSLHNAKWGKFYYMAILHTQMLFIPKTQIYCFSSIELIKTTILSYHLLNFVKKWKSYGWYNFWPIFTKKLRPIKKNGLKKWMIYKRKKPIAIIADICGNNSYYFLSLNFGPILQSVFFFSKVLIFSRTRTHFN